MSLIFLFYLYYGIFLIRRFFIIIVAILLSFCFKLKISLDAMLGVERKCYFSIPNHRYASDLAFCTLKLRRFLLQALMNNLGAVVQRNAPFFIRRDLSNQVQQKQKEDCYNRSLEICQQKQSCRIELNCSQIIIPEDKGSFQLVLYRCINAQNQNGENDLQPGLK